MSAQVIQKKKSPFGNALNDSSTLLQVYNFLDKMSFYTQVYKHKPNDIVSNDEETLWRRQTPKLLYPLGQSLKYSIQSETLHFFNMFFVTSCSGSGSGQTNLWMPQGVLGQVMIAGEQGFMVRWDYSYSSWTLFTCEVEMLLHVVSTAGMQSFK